MSEKGLHEQLQEKVLKILNWIMVVVCILFTILLISSNRMSSIPGLAILLVGVILSQILVHRGVYTIASYLTVTGVFVAVTSVAMSKLDQHMAVFEIGMASTVAVMIATLLSRNRLFAPLSAFFAASVVFTFGMVLQPPVLGFTNYADTGITIIALILMAILADCVYRLTGEITSRFRQEELANILQRKQILEISEHSASGKGYSVSLETQAKRGDDISNALISIVRQLSEKIHSLDIAMREFIARNQNVSDAAGNIMGVFNRHRDGLESYRSKAENISSTSQEINFITQSKRSQLDELIGATRSGEERMKKSILTIEKVAEDSKNMLNMISLIMEVAERTNVLALNAAVEASRAGKAGGGFAIVAKEIKNLSTETTQNTDVISRSLRTNIKSIEEAVETIRHAGDSFVGINANLSDFSTAIDDIAFRVNALSEQNIEMSTETKDILVLVDEVQQVLEKMLIFVEQSAAKVSGLQNTSEGLDQSMSELQAKASSMQGAVQQILDTYKDFAYCSSRVSEIAEDMTSATPKTASEATE
ncbi:MAG: methyl-accepting chemotaxis protein [Brevinema sp.]